MHLSPDSHNRFRFGQIALFLVAIALTSLGIAGLATQAKAAPVTLKVDHAQTLLGVFVNEPIIPATANFPSDSLPLPQRTDIQLNGTETDGQLNFPASTNGGTQIPYMNLPHPTIEGLKIPFTFRLKEPGLSGTYDNATGAATVSGNMDIIVITGTGTSFPLPDGLSDGMTVPPLGLFARCRIPNVPVSFSTETKFPFTGEHFSGGFGVNGALVTSWDRLPEVVSENGGECELIPAATNGSGGLWFSNTIVEPKPLVPKTPTCETDQRLCPDPVANISALKVSPKKKIAKAGKLVKLKVKVTNTGDGDQTALRIKVKSSNKRVKVPKTVVMDVDAGTTAIKTIRARVKKQARGKTKITLRTAGLKATSSVKIKKLKVTKRK